MLFANPWYLVFAVARRISHLLPDALYIRLLYKASLGRWPNLTNPKRFTEKLQWLKLHDRNPLYTSLVDKLEVKKHISKVLGAEYVFKTLGVWERAEEIDFDALPEKFVLKCNHMGGGSVFICKDKKSFDKSAVVTALKKQMKKNIFWAYREWPYKNVVPKIFAEEYMEDEYGELRDYKFYSLNGNPQFVLVASNRYSSHNFDSFDMGFNPLPTMTVSGRPNPAGIEKPECFSRMIELVSKLSSGFHFVRVDLYCIKGRIYFGELTFYPASGLDNRDSDEWDVEFGSHLDLKLVR